VDADPAPDPAYHIDADPDPVPVFYADPDPDADADPCRSGSKTLVRGMDPDPLSSSKYTGRKNLLSLKNDVTVPSKCYKQKNLELHAMSDLM
jgi:hypothetical protein